MMHPQAVFLKALFVLKVVKRKFIKFFLKIAPRDLYNLFRYGLGAPRYAQTFYLDPGKIKLAVVWQEPGRLDTGKVLGGDWDYAVRNLDEVKKITMTKLHIIENKSWEEVGAYELMAELLAQHGSYDDCVNVQDVIARYEKLDGLIKGLHAGDGFLQMSRINRYNYRESGGVYVHVGRNGDYIFGLGGCHRLAIAQALGVREIPVQVGMVHELAVLNGYWRNVSKPNSYGSRRNATQ